MISIGNLSVQFGGNFLFDDATFVVGDKDRIGLVGKNGAGKTTLLKIIAGIQEPEKGSVGIPKDTTIGYLQQELSHISDMTVLNETLTAFKEHNLLRAKIEEYTHAIATRTDYESEDYSKLLQKSHDASEHFNLIGGNNIEENVEKVLMGLGYDKSEFDRPLKELSGGWQMRVELAKILLRRPNVILLDEPTNHLDIEAIQWLEEFLKNYEGAVVLVSHDRALLDNVTNRTVEISLGKMIDFKAAYSEYVEIRAGQREIQKASFNNQQKQIADTEKFIERFRYKASKSKQVQSRVKMLDKIDRVEIDDVDTSAIHFKFPPAPRSGRQVVVLNNMGKKYGEKTILQNLEFIIDLGDKIAFVGRNGEGKTTLSRIIVGELEHSGECTIGHNVVIGYYAQNQDGLLKPDKTVFQTIDDAAVGEVRTRTRAILGSFLFGADDIDKKVKVLSGGEKSRLALALLLLTPINLLVLDEPTNHLDMKSKDVLKRALMMYDGTMLIVSHDRDFLQGLTTKVFEFKNKGVKQHIGDIYSFIESRKIQSLKQLEEANKAAVSKQENYLAENKNNWEEKKLAEREIRKQKNKISKCEDAISVYEREIEKIDEALANPESHADVISSKETFQKYEDLKTLLGAALQLWEKLHATLEALEKKI